MLSRARRRVPPPSKEQVGDQEDMGSMWTPQSSEGESAGCRLDDNNDKAGWCTTAVRVTNKVT